MTSEKINVEGMSCGHCKAAVTRAVSALKGVSAVEVSLEEKTVKVEYDETVLPLDRIRETIREEGYRVAS